MSAWFKRSPHLSSVASRMISNLSLPFLDRCFTVAINQGGEFEWDFSRDRGASYNPLPARVALILLNDGKIRNAAVIAAAMLASVGISVDETKYLLSEEDSRVVGTLLEQVYAFPLTATKDAPAEPNIASVVCALWLDRARHIHLITGPNKISNWHHFRDELAPIITTTTSAHGSLHLLLSTWLSRFTERLNLSMTQIAQRG